MKYLRKFENIKIDPFEDEFEWEEYDLEGNNIGEKDLEDILNLIDEIVEKHGYSKYEPKDFNIGDFLGQDGITSRTITIFESEDKNAKRVFAIEIFFDKNKSTGYSISYYDKNMHIIKGRLDIIKMLLKEQL
jgi:hypothetical protein